MSDIDIRTGGVAGPEAERRCEQCGALAGAEAKWCGQCLSPLPGLEPARRGNGSAKADKATAGRQPFWPCPVCEHANAIQDDSCVVCGTAFADAMRAFEQAPKVDAARAVRWSLVFPGLGHRLVGLPLDGLARAVLFALALGMSLLAILSGLSSAVVILVFAVLVLIAIGVYAGSAVEAERVAHGGDLLVSSRTLMWVTVVVLLGSIALLVGAVTSAPRR